MKDSTINPAGFPKGSPRGERSRIEAIATADHIRELIEAALWSLVDDDPDAVADALAKAHELILYQKDVLRRAKRE